MSGSIKKPEIPEYFLPREEKIELIGKIGLGFYLMISILVGMIALSILGYIVETTSFGDKVSFRSILV